MKTNANGGIDNSEILYDNPCGIGGAGTNCGIIQKGFYLTVNTTGHDSSDEEVQNVLKGVKNFPSVNIDGGLGYESTSFEEAGGYKQTRMWVYLLNDKKIYSISSTFPSNNKYYSELFDQILSTFKFTSQ